MSDARTEEIAKSAGREAAHEVLSSLGLDVSTPDARISAQRDLMFLRDLRLGASAIKRRTFMAIVGALTTAAIAYITLLLQKH